MSEARRIALLDALRAHVAESDVEAASLARIIAFVERTPAPFDRATLEGHITGSAVVMSGDGTRFFVLHHRKLDRWLQPGGHSDAEDDSTLATALREAREETGLTDLKPGNSGQILDVDAHDIPAHGAEPAHVHYDIRYLLMTSGAATTYNMVEAAGARWITLDEIDGLDVDASLARALHKAARSPACANCNAVLTGEYCSVCGEHRMDAHDLSLASFLRRTFHNLTNIDATFIASIRTLVTKPGLLTLEYIHGRRKRYLQPLDLFLLINLLYFLGQAIAPMPIFTTTLNTHMHRTMHQQIARKLVSKKLERLTPVGADSVGRSRVAIAYASRFDANAHAQAKSLVILMVPLFALVLALLYAGSEKPAVQHIIFSLHFYTWFLLLLTAYAMLLYLVVAILRVLSSIGIHTDPAVLGSDLIASLPIIIGVAAYLSFAMRRAYGTRGFTALLRTAGAVLGVMGALFLYRMILFFTVFYTT